MYDDIIVKPVSMTSREVAEITNKRHDHVLRDIRAMTDRLSAAPDLGWHCESETYKDAQGKEREQYRMDRDTTLTLLAGYDPVARMRIIKRWQELEAEALSRAEQDHLDNFWLKNRRLASSKYVYMQEEVLESLENNPEILAIDAKHLADPDDYAKKQEANFINEIVIGMRAHAFRYRYGIDIHCGIRDKMPARILQAYESLEDRNASLLNAGVPKEQRQKSLEHSMQRVFPDVVAFREVAALEKQYCVVARASKTFEYTHPSGFLELVAEMDVAARLSDRTIKKLECDSAKKTLAQRKMEMINMISEVAIGDDETMFDD